MARRLFNLATLLSLVLCAVSVVMWARSLLVTEGWDFTPRLHANAHSGKGWFRQRLVESGGGRLVYVDYEGLNTQGRHSYSHAKGTWTFVETVSPLPVAGYRRSSTPLTPDLQGKSFFPLTHLKAQAISGRIPGVAEWCIVPFQFQRRFIAVSWLALAAVGAVVPSARVAARWWRRHRLERPAFPVLLPPARSPE